MHPSPSNSPLNATAVVVRKAEDTLLGDYSSSSSNKRQRLGSDITINNGNHNKLLIYLLHCEKRVKVQVSRQEVSLELLLQHACQSFRFEACTLKQGYPPYEVVEDTTKIHHQDLLEVVEEKLLEESVSQNDVVVDLTNDANDDEVEEAEEKVGAVLLPDVLTNIHQEAAPFGRFKGKHVYRNKISHNEHSTGGHYSINELVPPDCTSALATTFGSDGVAYMEQIFSAVPKLLVATPSRKDEQPGAIIGSGIVLPMQTTRNQHEPSWLWLKTRPHTEGCLHAKLLIFRCPRGLRVVVSGNNLCQHQQTRQRDVFWAQDFPIKKYNEDTGYCSSDMDEKEEDVFQEKLELFLYGLATCAAREDNELVRGRISSLVRFIDFSNANASLVTSFPRPIASKDERNCGGYKDLARAISREMKKHREMAPIPKKSTLYVTSGSIGNLEPDFVYQMHKAMRGSTIQKKRSWRQLAYRFRCLWPSKQTALRSDLVGLSCVRGMPDSHFYGIPEASRRKMFHNSRPNPPDSRIQQTLFPTVHGKFLWNESGILYVGSHNFSKAAWGLGGMMPKNVELGVVLVSPNKKQQETWIERLPCELVAKTERSDSYKPFIGVNDPEFVDERHMGNMREIILEESSMVLEKLIL